MNNRHVVKAAAAVLLGLIIGSSLVWAEEAEVTYEPVSVEGLTPAGQMEFKYATGVDVYRYEDGYKLIDIHEGGGSQYLIVPEGKEAPEGLDSDVRVLQQPLDQIYLAATASMALFDAMDALDTIKYSSLQAGGWYIQDATDAMNAGKIAYAGKYSTPDYELLLGSGCDLAVESTMILHSPDVQEMLENLGIPVFIDWASYETHPLGRTEWIKVYAAMVNKEDVAEAFFDEQIKVLKEMEGVEKTDKTVAFFSVNSTGVVVIRNATDYIPKMLDLAGGVYIPTDVETIGQSKKSSLNITMEEFYNTAVNADYLVYNSTIEEPIGSLADLYDKSALFQDFKAVKEGHVWCTDKYLYQATDIVGQLIMDFHYMLTDQDESQMTFLRKVN